MINDSFTYTMIIWKWTTFKIILYRHLVAKTIQSLTAAVWQEQWNNTMKSKNI